MTTIPKDSSEMFAVGELFSSTATRPNGLAARQRLRDALRSSPVVTVDLQGVALTPSFADEFLGVLLVELGEGNFRRTVKIVNVEGSSRNLLRHVLASRAAYPYVDVSAHNRLHSR
ncbi:hypothetical protein C7E18_17165 [Stenotrophomonas maltophilia]|nr:hypothetical protein C7E18_17165 [Stenotrophomonas maltophilia]